MNREGGEVRADARYRYPKEPCPEVSQRPRDTYGINRFLLLYNITQSIPGWFEKNQHGLVLRCADLNWDTKVRREREEEEEEEEEGEG